MTEDEVYINEIINSQSIRAYNSLVEKYENRVFSLCFKIIKNREIAEEVAQDVFVVGFKKISELNDKNKFPNWLMKNCLFPFNRLHPTKKERKNRH